MPAHGTLPTRLVAVLAGGDSAERDISLRSGDAVAQALQAAGYQIIAVDPAERPLPERDWSHVDACFIALHGGAGEDGRVQQQLEELGIPYTGSNPRASKLAMSKSASKQRFAECGVPTLPWATIDTLDAIADPLDRVAPLGYPLVIKPDAQGSSLGVTVVDDDDALDAALETAGAFDGLVIAEPLAVGREFTVATIDQRALPPLEIVTPEATFSYEAKYASKLTEYRFEFDLPADARQSLVDVSLDAVRALGVEGLARVDLMVDRQQRVWVLEVNTVPGMTPRSLAPLAASRAGISMAALCNELVCRCQRTLEAV